MSSGTARKKKTREARQMGTTRAAAGEGGGMAWVAKADCRTRTCALKEDVMVEGSKGRQELPPSSWF